MYKFKYMSVYVFTYISNHKSTYIPAVPHALGATMAPNQGFTAVNSSPRGERVRDKG
jgi:hypothetical protein